MIATTTVDIERPHATSDPYEAAPTVHGERSVPAHLSAPSARDVAIGGDKEVITAVCFLPIATDVGRSDRIVDAQGGTYDVTWVQRRRGLGLDHTVAGVRIVNGAANG